jgi:pyruvate/2-oxoglutarate dehydrogenase complex dihydrolipoamide acyltransferase (E2) component
MATDIIIPKLGFTMTEGTIAEWRVASGAPVKEGQALYSLEAEKATQEIEAPASGTLTILVAAGEAAAVGAVIGTIS